MTMRPTPYPRTVEATAVMPTVEMGELHTQPLPALPMDMPCAWCGIRLRAVPDAPKPYKPRDTDELAWYHPTGCIAAARNADAGIRIDRLS